MYASISSAHFNTVCDIITFPVILNYIWSHKLKYEFCVNLHLYFRFIYYVTKLLTSVLLKSKTFRLQGMSSNIHLIIINSIERISSVISFANNIKYTTKPFFFLNMSCQFIHLQRKKKANDWSHDREVFKITLTHCNSSLDSIALVLYFWHL